jgi:hypothetical protein
MAVSNADAHVRKVTASSLIDEAATWGSADVRPRRP